MMDLSKTAWIVSVFLHGALVALLILGPSLRPTVAPTLPVGNVLEAVMVDPSVFDLPPLEEPTGPTPAELERERLEQERLERQAELDAAAQAKAEQEARQKAQQEAEEEAQRVAELTAKREAEEAAKRQADLKAKQDAEAEAKRQADLKVKREADAEAKRQADLKAKQEADAEAKRQADLKVKQEAEAEAKRQAELKAKREAEAEAKRKADLKAKQEAEAKAKRLAAAKAEKEAEQKAREEEMRRAMGLESQRNQAVDNGLLAQYIAQIVAKVERNWSPPPGVKQGLSCTVRASQLPGGDVATVEVVECNGDEAVQRSIYNAVFKASPLPEPADPTLFERNLVFIFEPK